MLKDGVLLRICITKSAQIHEKPAYNYLVDSFPKKKLPGCTVFRDMAGCGHENTIQTGDVVNLSPDLPLIIDVVDTGERIRAIVPAIEGMVEHGLVTVQSVQVGVKTAR